MAGEQSIWTYRIKDESGNILCNLIGAQERKLNRGLNKPGDASLSYDLKDFFLLAQKLDNRSVDDLVGTGHHILEVLRGGSVLWGGEMSTKSRSVSATERRLQLKALGHLQRLDQAVVALTSDIQYTATDAGAIIQDVINDLQADPLGDMGYTFGTVDTSVNRTVTLSRKKVKELIEDFSGTDNGFDVDISSDKVINLYYPFKGADKSDYVEFKYPGNIAEIEEVQNVDELANYIFAIGKGSGDLELNVTREDVDAEASAVGRRMAVESFKDVDNATVLGDIAQQLVDERKAIPTLYKLKLHGNASPTVDLYSTGDFVKVTVNDDYWNFSQVFRVFEIYIDIDENDNEDVTLTVGLI